MGDAIAGIMIPFLGTSAGAALVFCMGRGLPPRLHRALTGFAAGVMAAASVWSLLLPAIEQSSDLGAWTFAPAVGGFWLGTVFVLCLEKWLARLDGCAGASRSTNAMLMLAVTIHNIPEGMAVGVVYAGLLAGRPGVTAMGALSLALGIAIQNVPEGAIISLPLRAGGMSRPGAFLGGSLSGAVEPVSAALMAALAPWLGPLMPWFLSIAAGTMFCVVVGELIPEMSQGRSNVGTLMFTFGFTLMMSLDVALG